ncbi:hypothetical protein BH10BAC6_BH10BAC6_15720 [soil metagenome]
MIELFRELGIGKVFVSKSPMVGYRHVLLLLFHRLRNTTDMVRVDNL